MKFTNIISGTIIAIIGIAIGYIDYYIASLFYEVSLWLSGLVHAPTAVTILLTIILILFFAGILIIIGIVSAYLIFMGVIAILDS